LSRIKKVRPASSTVAWIREDPGGQKRFRMTRLHTFHVPSIALEVMHARWVCPVQALRFAPVWPVISMRST